MNAKCLLTFCNAAMKVLVDMLLLPFAMFGATVSELPPGEYADAEVQQ